MKNLVLYTKFTILLTGIIMVVVLGIVGIGKTSRYVERRDKAMIEKVLSEKGQCPLAQ